MKSNIEENYMGRRPEDSFEIEFKTNFNILNEINYIEDIDLKQLIKTINKRIVSMYNRDHSIGHVYFATLINKKELEAKEELANIFKKKIIPLLKRYFDNDFNKIREILSDDKKEEKYQFIKRRESLSLNDLIEDDKFYEINDSAFLYACSYKKIYE